MNDMYTLSIQTHDLAIMAILLLIGINAVLLVVARDIKRYAKQMRVMMPLTSTMLAVIIFTGVVMMGAKHLGFSLQNTVMILYTLMFIMMEVKRRVWLKRTDPTLPNALENYRMRALMLLAVEALLTFALSFWML